MAGKKPIFNILADFTTGEGEPAISRTEGEAAAGIAGLIGFSFQDQSGNVVLPTLTAAGAVPVSMESGTPVFDEGEVTTVALDTDITVATLTLNTSKTYDIKSIFGSSFQMTSFRLVQTDDATDTDVFLAGRVGAGDYNFEREIPCHQITTGASGTQELKLVAQQCDGPIGTKISGSLCAFELP